MPARDYYLKDKTLETVCANVNSAPHTHTVAPVWRAERGQPLGGGCARPAGGGVLRSAAHRRVEFRLPVWLRGVFIIAVHHAFVLGLGARHGGIVKLSVVRCVTVFASFTYLLTSVQQQQQKEEEEV